MTKTVTSSVTNIVNFFNYLNRWRRKSFAKIEKRIEFLISRMLLVSISAVFSLFFTRNFLMTDYYLKARVKLEGLVNNMD